MPTIRTILVYASLEDEALLALQQGAALARRHGAALTLLRVLPDDMSLVSRLRSGGQGQRIRRAMEEGQRALLESAAAPLREEGLCVDVELRWGAPWFEVIQAVLRDGHDLVLKTAEGAARGQGLFFGSTAMHLIRKCPCPVWILGGDPGAGPERVLAAVDPDPEGGREAVAQQVLAYGRIAAGEHGELHAVSAWWAPGETLLRNRMRPEDLADYVRDEETAAREQLEAILADTNTALPPERIHLPKGEPRRVLPEVAESGAFDLVVAGSVGRAGVVGLLIGETAETLVRSTHCSVLVVKPPGFVSPVPLRDRRRRARSGSAARPDRSSAPGSARPGSPSPDGAAPPG